MIRQTAGFTLLELLVVISIIGFLVSVVITVTSPAKNKAKQAVAINDIRKIEQAIWRFRFDTNTNPQGSCRNVCNAALDPFSNSLGISGWRGPYFKLIGKTHPWGGQFGFTNGYDIDGDGIEDLLIVLEDDRPGTSDVDNQGVLPLEVMLQIDATLDDGNLETGKVIGNGNWPTAEGEIMIKI